MTRDDHRAECIEAMAIAAHDADVATEIEPRAWDDEIEEVRAFWIKVETAAFDSLADVADVFAPGLDQIVGRLTNPPEKKP